MSCVGEGPLFTDGTSDSTLASTGVLVSLLVFEYIMESAFSESAHEPTVELSAAFDGA